MRLAMMLRTFTDFVRGRIGGFARDDRGVSAIEFALLSPLMITLYLGGVEVTQAVTADRKTTLVAHTVADLIAQESDITDSEMSNVLNATASVATPLPTSNLVVIVSSICIDANSKATVKWSSTLNGTIHASGTVVNLPSALAVANTSLIWGEATYTYKPTIGYVITGPLTLHDKIYLRPRLGNPVTRNGTSGCP